MIASFIAHACRVSIEDSESDEGCVLIVIADNDEYPGTWIELQKSLGQDDPQNNDLGMDSYCVVTDTGATFYGGITACLLANDTLHLTLSQEATQLLGVERYMIRLAISDQERELLRQGLEMIFQGDTQAPRMIYQ